MTVQTQIRKITVDGNGSATVHSFSPIVINKAAELIVTHVDANNVETVLSEGQTATTYSVTASNFPTTGSITYPAMGGDPLPSGEKLIITRVLTLEQQTDLENQGGYNAEVQEKQYDRFIMIDLQQQELLDRALVTPVSDTAVSLEIPNQATRANKYLTFDASGIPTVTDAATASGTSVLATGSTTARLLADRAAEVYNVLDYGAVGDGVTDDGGAFNTAITAANAAGGGIVFAPPKSYNIVTQIVLKANVTIEGEDGTVLLVGLNDQIITTAGSIATGSSNTLASNAAVGDTTLTLSSGKGANFSAGDWALLLSTAAPAQAQAINARGEIVRVKSVSTDTLTLDGPISDAYTTAATAEVQVMTMVDRPGLKNLLIRNNDTASYTATATEWGFCYQPTITNVVFDGGKSSAMIFQGCVQPLVSNCRAYDLLSSATEFGYMVVEAGPNLGLVMVGCLGERVRHVYTTTEGKEVSGVTVNNGFPTGSVIDNCTAVFPRAAGFDTHADGRGITFNNCSVFGSAREGFQIRGEDNHLSDCMAYGCTSGGFSFSLSVRASAANCRAYRCATGTDPETGINWLQRASFYDVGDETILDDCISVLSGASGFEFANNAAALTPIYRDCIAIDSGQLAATTYLDGFKIATSQSTEVTLTGCIARDSTSKMENGFYATNAAPTLRAFNCYSTGHQTAAFSGVANANWGHIPGPFSHETSKQVGATVVEHYGDGINNTAIYTLTNVALTVGNSASLGVGLNIGNLPAGNITIHNAYVEVDISGVSTTTDTPECGLGTTIASGAVSVLGGTPAFENIMEGAAMADTNGTAYINSVATLLNVLTGGAHTIYLNFADAWGANADASALVNGTVRISYTYNAA